MAIIGAKQTSREGKSKLPGEARPDAFFTEAQICRLRELMQRVQAAQKPPEEVLTATEYQELQSLIQEELRASVRRAAAHLNSSTP